MRRMFQQPQQIRRRQLRNQRQARTVDRLIDQQTADGRRQHAKSVELVQAMVELEREESEQGRGEVPGAAGHSVAGGGRAVLQVGAQEGRDVGPRLRHDEVVHVEELGDAREWRVAVRVAGLAPGAERDALRRGPGHDGVVFVFALQRYGRVERRRGGVGGEGRGPD